MMKVGYLGLIGFFMYSVMLVVFFEVMLMLYVLILVCLKVIE